MPGAWQEPVNSFTAAAGDIFLFAKGSVWEWDSGYWNINNTRYDFATTGSPITFGAYDRPGESGEDDPTIWKRWNIAANEWSISSGDIWQADSPNAAARAFGYRVFFANIGQSRMATSLATVNATNPWWYDESIDRLYAYSSGGVDPTTTHGIVWASYRDDASYTSRVYGASHIHFENIEFRGGWYACTLLSPSGNSISDIKFTNITCNYTHGGIAASNTLVGETTSNIQIDGLTVDVKWQDAEVGSPDDQDVTYFGQGDGLFFGSGAQDIIVENSEFIGLTHAGVNINKSDTPTLEPATNIEIKNCIFRDTNNNHGRGFGFTGVNADSTANIHFHHNLIINMPTRCQLDCPGISCHHNIIMNQYGDDITNWNAQGFSMNTRSNALIKDLKLYNNTIINTREEPIKVNLSTWNNTVNLAFGDNVHIYNNLVYQQAGFQKDDQEVLSLVFFYAGSNSSAAAWSTVRFYNNMIYSEDYGIGGTSIYAQTGLMTLAAAESAYPTQIFNNIEADARFTANSFTSVEDAKLSGQSPCIGAGIPPLDILDYFGDTRKSNAGFDIGAVWFDGPSDTTVERILASGGTK